jgi:DnaK suppressor protein
MTKPLVLKSRREFVAKTREHLESMRAALVQEFAANIRAAHSTSNSETMDSADLASKELEQNMTLILSGREKDRSIAIDDALKRINNGNYGVCTGCGFEISELRLQVMPFTGHCRDCQQDQEHEAKSRYRGLDIHQEPIKEFESNFVEEQINQEPMRRSGNAKNI